MNTSSALPPSRADGGGTRSVRSGTTGPTLAHPASRARPPSKRISGDFEALEEWSGTSMALGCPLARRRARVLPSARAVVRNPRAGLAAHTKAVACSTAGLSRSHGIRACSAIQSAPSGMPTTSALRGQNVFRRTWASSGASVIALGRAMAISLTGPSAKSAASAASVRAIGRSRMAGV